MSLPGFRAATRFGVFRTLGFAAAVGKAALPEESDREAFRARATEVITDGWELTFDFLLRAGLIERTADRLLSEGVIERVATAAVDHPATEPLLLRLVENPAFERLLLIVVQSDLFDRLLDRTLASEQLDRVVSQIAESDEVHDALREQSQGMADEVTDELRSRTMTADAFLERVARSVIRRRAAPPRSGPAGAGA
jgi:hypothetical protein